MRIILGSLRKLLKWDSFPSGVPDSIDRNSKKISSILEQLVGDGIPHSRRTEQSARVGKFCQLLP